MDPQFARLLDEAEARQLPAVIAEWESVDDARSWIARALKLDLALLIEQPDLMLPCLYRRCARFRDEGGWLERQVAPPAAEVRSLVELVPAAI